MYWGKSKGKLSVKVSFDRGNPANKILSTLNLSKLDEFGHSSNIDKILIASKLDWEWPQRFEIHLVNDWNVLSTYPQKGIFWFQKTCKRKKMLWILVMFHWGSVRTFRIHRAAQCTSPMSGGFFQFVAFLLFLTQTEGTTGCATTNANFTCPPEMDLCFHLNGNYFYETMSVSKRAY